MWKKMNAKEKAIMDVYKQNPDLAQSYWHCIRSFKEGCGYLMEEMYNVLIFATRDPKMQALTGKLYNDWAHERYLQGLPADDWNLFVRDVLTELVRKLGETLNIDVSSWPSVQK